MIGKSRTAILLAMAPKEKNIYFYNGWLAYADGLAFTLEAVVDWRLGWSAHKSMEREAMLDAEIGWT